MKRIIIKIKTVIYHWMLNNLPYWIMYKHLWVDSQHKMWFPRWGYTKKQISEVEKESKELFENLKWD